MFVRLNSYEEDRNFELTPANALVIQEKDIEAYILSHRFVDIPEHIKRVKKDSNRFLIFKSLGNCTDNTGVNIMIPKHKPVTKEQYEKSKSFWPCYFFNIYDDVLDQNQLYINYKSCISYYNEIVKNSNYNNSDCTDVCLIFDNNTILARSYDTNGILGHSAINAIREVSRKKSSYLCTGYSVFVMGEPCMSCTMAMIHGRVKKVFCLVKSDSSTSSFTGLKFNYNYNLNHRFNVYFWE